MAEDRPLRILFSSYHCYFDPSSGATVSLRDLFRILGQRGWDCQAFSGPLLDYEKPTRIPDLLKQFGVKHRERSGRVHGAEFILYNAVIDGIPLAVYDTPAMTPAKRLSHAQAETHLSLFDRVLTQFQPDVVLTYGGQVMAGRVMQKAQAAGAAVVFWLRNTAYTSKPFFQYVDGVLVPSKFSVAFYRRTIGLHCTAIPSPLDWDRIHCPHIERKYLTFINPTPVKGVYWFAGLVQELAKSRPDIPILVVESRGQADWLEHAGLDLRKLPNLRVMPNTRDPRDFIGISKLMLAPSAWAETFGRVAAEAMINGIPVIASNRGGLPDVVGSAGTVLALPDDFTPTTRTMPTAEALTPWLTAITRLWDDQSEYVSACLRARIEAEKWDPDRLGLQYDRYFRQLLAEKLQPPPELVETAEAPLSKR